MNSAENTLPAIEFRETDEFGPQAALFGSVTFLLFWTSLFAVIVHGKPEAFFTVFMVVGIGLAVQQVGKWFASTAKQYKLFFDRLLMGDVEITLDEIVAIEWPIKRDGDKKLAVKYSLRDSNLEGRDEEQARFIQDLLSIPINKLELEDRLLMVRYLQQIDCDQKNWEEFCCLFLDQWLPRRQTAWDHLNDKFKASPFWSGFIYAPYIAMLCLLSVSKHVYWLVGATVVASTVINVRLMHGEWLSPVGEVMLGGGAFVFCLGIVAALFPSRQKKRELTPSQQIASHQAAVLFVLTFIFGPLAFQLLLMNGWRFLVPLFQLVPFLPTVPLFMERIRDQKNRRENPQKYIAMAMQKWESYCESILGEVAEIDDSVEQENTSTMRGRGWESFHTRTGVEASYLS